MPRTPRDDVILSKLYPLNRFETPLGIWIDAIRNTKLDYYSFEGEKLAYTGFQNPYMFPYMGEYVGITSKTIYLKENNTSRVQRIDQTCLFNFENFLDENKNDTVAFLCKNLTDSQELDFK